MSRRTTTRRKRTATCPGNEKIARTKSSTNPPPDDEETGTVECYNCKKDIEKDEATKHDDEYYCEECFGEIFGICDDCGDIIDRDDLTWVETAEREVCESCLSRRYKKCVSCEKFFKRDDVVWSGEEAYCERCASEHLFFCDLCNEYHSVDDSVEVGGDLYCESCAEESAYCELCGERFFTDDMEEYEGDKYICARCAKKKRAVKCPSCFAYFQKEDIDAASGKCLACLEQELEADATGKFSDDDVLSAFPGLVSGIKKVFDRSSANRSIDARVFSKKLADMFPEDVVTFDFKSMTIKTGYGEKGIADLKSPRNSIRKMILDGMLFKDKNSNDVLSAIDYYVDKITNTENDIRNLEKEMEKTIASAVAAIKIRFYKEAMRPDVKSRTDALEGTDVLEAGGTRYTFVITKDPVAILAKTTSQCWESMSCEKLIRGQYGKGAFSDIANSNLVCFVLDDKKLPLARIMIRWCYTEKKEIDFGIEKKWYYCTVRPEEATQFNGMGTSSNVHADDPFIGGLRIDAATKFLLKILEKRGKSKPFTTCSTPYVYDGYSDTQGSGHTRVRYPKYG